MENMPIRWHAKKYVGRLSLLKAFLSKWTWMWLPVVLIIVALWGQVVFEESFAGKHFLLLYPAMFIGSLVTKSHARWSISAFAVLGAWVMVVPVQRTLRVTDLHELFGLLIFSVNCVVFNLLASSLETKSRALRKALRNREHFLGVASHELRTPCTVLLLQSELQRIALSNEQQSTALVKFVDMVNLQAKRLVNTIDTLMDVTRIDTETLELKRTYCDLREIVEGVVQQLSVQIASAQCRVSVAALKSVRGYWDKTRLEQVVSNLITNATKYASGKPIVITINRRGDSACASICDEGVGIAPGDINHIFSRYQRCASTSRHDSLGLGLFIANEIVQAHGGHFRVDSKPGLGSNFCFTLPAASSPEIQTA